MLECCQWEGAGSVIRRQLVLGHSAEEDGHVLHMRQRLWIYKCSYSRATVFEKVARGERQIATGSEEEGTAETRSALYS